MKTPRKPKVTKKRPYLSIILPVFNEEENIVTQYNSIVSAMAESRHPYELLFIDDGSSDRSADLLREIAARDRRVKLVIFRRNFGQTAAMAAGIDHSRGTVLVFMDSDLQNDATDIDMMVKKIEEGYDVVSGWRKDRKDSFFSRKLPSKIANWLIARATGVAIHDLGCSLKAYRGEILRLVNLYGEMHRFIPVHASWIGAKITEVPVKHHPRKYGKSKYGLKRTFKVILDLITVIFMGKYSTKPIYVFGGTGILMFIGSMLSGGLMLGMKFILGLSMIRNPLLLLTVLFIILSVLFIQIGILAEILIRIYHESKGMSPYRVLETKNIETK